MQRHQIDETTRTFIRLGPDGRGETVHWGTAEFELYNSGWYAATVLKAPETPPPGQEGDQELWRLGHRAGLEQLRKFNEAKKAHEARRAG